VPKAGGYLGLVSIPFTTLLFPTQRGRLHLVVIALGAMARGGWQEMGEKKFEDITRAATSFFLIHQILSATILLSSRTHRAHVYLDRDPNNKFAGD
jgi:hypothetical protein